MAEPTPETEFYGLTRLSRGEDMSKNGYAALDLDRITLDKVLRALENHQHTAEARLSDPADPPGTSVSTTGGTLPAGTTFYYKISWLDIHGLETAASPEASATTTSPIERPTAPSLSIISSGGSLAAGAYSYAITFRDSAGNETTPSSRSTIQVESGSTNQIQIDLPSLPAGAIQWRIYRSRPGQTRLYLLTTVSATPYDDDGSLSEDSTITPPRFNRTNGTNSITIDVGGATPTIPDGVFGWNIYRTTVPGSYPGASLVHSVVETDAVDSEELLTSWTDDGDSLQRGKPRSNSATLGGGRVVELTQVQGSLPLATMPRGSRMWSTFIPGTPADSTTYGQTRIPSDIQPSALTAHFITAPTGLTASDTVTIRVSDGGSTPASIDLVCDSNDPYHETRYSLTTDAQLEAEHGTRSDVSTVQILNDEDASNTQSVAIELEDEWVEVELGVLDVGDYTGSVSIRLITGKSAVTDDIRFEVLDASDDSVVVSDVFTAQEDYTTHQTPEWTADGVKSYKLRVTKDLATSSGFLVDVFNYQADLITLQEGLITLSVLINGSPTTNGSDVNAVLWF